MVDLKRMSAAVLGGDAATARELTVQALTDGIAPSHILADGLISAMDELGEQFGRGEVFLPNMLVAARAMHASLNVLRPKLVETGAEPSGRVVLGTVRGDVHDLGKNLVGMMLEGAGFDVHDLGVDVSPEAFVEAAGEEGIQVVAMSTLLTTTMPEMKQTIEALRDAGLSGRVRTLVGGAPVTERYAAEIGADAFSPDASRAVATTRGLVAAAGTLERAS